MSTPDLPADRVEAKERIAEGEKSKTPAPAEPTPVKVTDPADDYKAPEVVPPSHDDVDVALQEGKDTADGKGDEEVPESNFEAFADPTADDGEEQN